MRLLPIFALAILPAALSYAQSAANTNTPADTQPSLIYRSEPEYSAEATRARVQSSVTLSIVVGEDGRAHDIKVTQGAGFGLDEKAIEAMAKWRFDAATHDGKPISAPANIEMNFSIQAKNDKEDRSGQRARLNFTLPPGASRPELIVGILPANPVRGGNQSLRFQLQVDAQGAPKNVTMLSSDDAAWAKQVLRLVQTWRFRPAAVNESPVAVEGVFEISHSGPAPEPDVEHVVRPQIIGGDDDEAPMRRPVAAVSLPVAGLIARTDHTATLLANGTVLLAGGAVEGVPSHETASAQTFDWATRSIAGTGNLLTARRNHTATLLRDGTVLIVGGETGSHALASAEIFDPSTGRFSSAGNMHMARSSHVAVALPDGRVLICGGAEKSLSAEIYDPRTKSFASAGTMTAARSLFRAVALKDGRVLLVGGAGLTAEIFDPETGAFSPTGSMTTGRNGFSATLLPGGQVLIAGGTSSASGGGLASAEIFDPATNSFHATSEMAWARGRKAGVLLTSGKVLVTGGSPQAEIYDPVTGKFSFGPLLTAAHTGDTATLLEDGSVLIAGSAAELVQVK